MQPYRQSRLEVGADDSCGVMLALDAFTLGRRYALRRGCDACQARQAGLLPSGPPWSSELS